MIYPTSFMNKIYDNHPFLLSFYHIYIHNSVSCFYHWWNSNCIEFVGSSPKLKCLSFSYVPNFSRNCLWEFTNLGKERLVLDVEITVLEAQSTFLTMFLSFLNICTEDAYIYNPFVGFKTSLLLYFNIIASFSAVSTASLKCDPKIIFFCSLLIFQLYFLICLTLTIFAQLYFLIFSTSTLFFV